MNNDKIFRDNMFHNKVVLITGGSSGINYEIALNFAIYGAKVTIIARQKEKLNTAVNNLKKYGNDIAGIISDVRNYREMVDAYKETYQKFGPIDILVAGAGYNYPGKILDINSTVFRNVIDVDLKGLFNTVHASFNFLKKPGSSIIVLSAVQATIPMRMQSAVCSAKAGVEMFAKTVALEWAPYAIRVNVIAPGPIEKTYGMDKLTPTSESANELINKLPLGRYGRKDEVANLALYLSSEMSTFITGSIMTIDGGAHLVGDGSGFL